MLWKIRGSVEKILVNFWLSYWNLKLKQYLDKPRLKVNWVTFYIYSIFVGWWSQMMSIDKNKISMDAP